MGVLWLLRLFGGAFLFEGLLSNLLGVSAALVLVRHARLLAGNLSGGL